MGVVGCAAILGDVRRPAGVLVDRRRSGIDSEEIVALRDGMEVGDALMVLVIEYVWASGLRGGALRDAGVVFAQQDYVTPEGLVALGALLGLEVALDDVE